MASVNGSTHKKERRPPGAWRQWVPAALIILVGTWSKSKLPSFAKIFSVRPHSPMLCSYYVDAPFTTFFILNVVKHLIGSWTHTWGADARIQQLLFWSLGLISTCKVPLHFCIFGGSVDDSSSLKLLILCLEPIQEFSQEPFLCFKSHMGNLTEQFHVELFCISKVSPRTIVAKESWK